MTFQFLDYVIFSTTLFISAAIGLYYRFTGGKQKTNEEYLLADGRQNPAWVALSLMASFMSAVSMLGGASEAYVYGTQFFVINLGYTVGMILAAYLFIPTFYKLKSVSVYKYLELRFGYATRICASLAFTFQMLLYMSITLVAPSIALQTITDISSEDSIVICGLVCLSYAFLGGMKAIIITDVFQSVLMFGATISVIYSAYDRLGSVSRIWEIAEKHQRINVFDFRLDPTIRHTWWSTFIGGVFSSIILNGINQTQVQRYLTMKDYRTVTIAVLSSALIIASLSLTICLSGLSVFAVYHDCDPIETKKIAVADQLLPFYVIEQFRGSGLSGLFVAGIFSASLSTISPLINALAAVTLEDHIKPFIAKCTTTEMKSTSSNFVAQILALFYGVSCIIISLLALKMTSILQASITVFSFVGGPMLGIFTLGMFTTKANQKGTIIGFFVGMASIAILCVGQPRPKPQPLPTRIDGCDVTDLRNQTVIPVLRNSTTAAVNYPYIYRISYMYYGVIGFFITFVVGYVFSLLIRDKIKKKVNVNLLSKLTAKRLVGKRSSLLDLEDIDQGKEET